LCGYFFFRRLSRRRRMRRTKKKKSRENSSPFTPRIKKKHTNISFSISLFPSFYSTNYFFFFREREGGEREK
jgi:hypothetical protein